MTQEVTCCFLPHPLSPFTHPPHHITLFSTTLVLVTGCGMDQRHQCATRHTLGGHCLLASSRDTSTAKWNTYPTPHIYVTPYSRDMQQTHNMRILTNYIRVYLLVVACYCKHKSHTNLKQCTPLYSVMSLKSACLQISSTSAATTLVNTVFKII